MHITLALTMLAIGLGCDAFSVAVCVGMAGATTREKLRLASGFGVFQFLMPITGMFVGDILGNFAGEVAAYIGGVILIGLGVIMVWRTLTEGLTCPPLIHRSFLALLTASLGVSLDALAVGFGYGMSSKEANVFGDSMFIGITAFLMTIVGTEIGGQAGKLLQHRAPLVGGLILIVLGIRVLLLQH